MFIAGTALASLLLLPCILPCLIRIVTSTVQASLETHAKPTQLMTLSDNQDTELGTAEEIYCQYKNKVDAGLSPIKEIEGGIVMSQGQATRQP